MQAAELLEFFQWSGADTEVDTENKLLKIREELADVLIYDCAKGLRLWQRANLCHVFFLLHFFHMSSIVLWKFIFRGFWKQFGQNSRTVLIYMG